MPPLVQRSKDGILLYMGSAMLLKFKSSHNYTQFRLKQNYLILNFTNKFDDVAPILNYAKNARKVLLSGPRTILLTGQVLSLQVGEMRITNECVTKGLLL